MRHHSSFAVFGLIFAALNWGCSDGEQGKAQSSTGGNSPSTTTEPNENGGHSSTGGSTNAATNPGAGASTGGSSSTNTAGSANTGGSSSTNTSGAAGNATGGTSSTPLSQVDCTDTATDTTALPERYSSVAVKVTDKDKVYQAATNWWHKFTAQTVTLNGLGFTVANSDNLSVPQTDGAPIGYPTLYVGSYSGSAGTGSNLPKQVSALTSVPTIFDTNGLDFDNSNYNAAYDVWFTKTGTPLPAAQYNPGKGGAYLMVWLFDPRDRQPRGTNKAPAHTVEGVPGTWDVWVDPSDPPCISYVSTTPLSGLAFDLNDFIKDNVTNGYGVTDSMFLSVVFAGFEIWGGGDGLKLKQYCTNVK
jgi:hypothetical protein